MPAILPYWDQRHHRVQRILSVFIRVMERRQFHYRLHRHARIFGLLSLLEGLEASWVRARERYGLADRPPGTDTEQEESAKYVEPKGLVAKAWDLFSK